MGDTDGFLSMGVIGTKFYFNKMTLLTMWKACGQRQKWLQRNQLQRYCSTFPGENIKGLDLGQGSEDGQLSRR